MILRDEKLLAEFRRAPRCEYCQQWTPHGCDPAHLMSRGAGRVDIRSNLMSLCRKCHSAAHYGSIKLAELFRIVCRREKTTVARIKAKVWRIRRLPKGSKP